jgi:hypothetical protein
MSEPREIPRLNPPPEGRILYGWCLYEDDRWDGPVPQDYDDEGWLVYPDRKSAFRGLAREMRRRCEWFDTGELPGESLACAWYPREVTYLPDGRVRDDTGAEFEPGKPWGG